MLNESCETCKPGYVGTTYPPKRCYRLFETTSFPVVNDIAAECKAFGDKLPMPLSKNENMDLVHTVLKNGWLPKISNTNGMPIDLRRVGTDYVMSNNQKPTWTPWSEREMHYKLQNMTYVGLKMYPYEWQGIESFKGVSAFVCQQICSKSSPGVTEITTKTHCEVCKSGYKSFSIDGLRQCFRYIDPSEVNGKYEAGTAESICKSFGDKLPFPQLSEERNQLKKIAKEFIPTGWVYPIDLKLNGSDYFMSNGQRPVSEYWLSDKPDKNTRKNFVVSVEFVAWMDVDASYWTKHGVNKISIICQQICSPGNYSRFLK